MSFLRRHGARLLILTAAAAFLLAAAALFSFLRAERPELFRKKTEMERSYPVCVLGVSERSGVISGDKAGIRNVYINWKTSFPGKAVKAIRAAGAVPMVTWEPYLENPKHDALLPEIAAGGHDAYIARFARQSAGAPLYVRFGHEPNSNWYGWSGAVSRPEVYVAAFRRVRQIFQAQGNSTARFVFSVNSEDVPAKPWNRFENYYPGDAYADVIGIDAFNWGPGLQHWRKWKTPGVMLSPVYERTVKAFPSKPVFVTETASCSAGGDKAAWIKDLTGAVQKRFPAVKAVLWFDFNKECDWTLSSEELRARFYGACDGEQDVA